MAEEQIVWAGAAADYVDSERAHGSFERVEGILQDWQPQFDGRINVRIQWTGAVYNFGILRED